MSWAWPARYSKPAGLCRPRRPARDAFLRFAAAAPWHANFRDLSAAVRRMATLADGGRIDTAEIARLEASARSGGRDGGLTALPGPRADELDRFDRMQPADPDRVRRARPGTLTSTRPRGSRR